MSKRVLLSFILSLAERAVNKGEWDTAEKLYHNALKLLDEKKGA